MKKKSHPVVIRHPHYKTYLTYDTVKKEYVWQDGATNAVVFEHHIAVEFLKKVVKVKRLEIVDVDELKEKSPTS